MEQLNTEDDEVEEKENHQTKWSNRPVTCDNSKRADDSCVLKMPSRSNSTSSVRIKSTMAQPDNAQIIQAVSEVLFKHLTQGEKFVQEFSRSRIPEALSFFEEIDLDVSDDDVVEEKEIGSPVSKALMSRFFESDVNVDTLEQFLTKMFCTAQCSVECNVICLVYVEQLLRCCGCDEGLNLSNWRPIVMTAMMLASKVWDDLSMVNEDFSIFMPYSLEMINEWEVHFLSCLQYNVRVRASEYARYYFNLRKECPALKEITMEKAKELEIVSAVAERRSRDLYLQATSAQHGKMRRVCSATHYEGSEKRERSGSGRRFVID